MSQFYNGHIYSYLTNKKLRDLLDKYVPAQNKIPLSAVLDMALADYGAPNRVWFVDLGAAATGNGSMYSPFNTLAEANAESADGDTINIIGAGATVNNLIFNTWRTYDFGMRPIYIEGLAGSSYWARIAGEGMIVIRNLFGILNALPEGFLNVSDGQVCKLENAFLVNPSASLVSSNPGILVSGVSAGVWGFDPELWATNVEVMFSDTGGGADFSNIALKVALDGSVSFDDSSIQTGTLAPALVMIDDSTLRGTNCQFRNDSATAPTAFIQDQAELELAYSDIENEDVAVGLVIDGANTRATLRLGTNVRQDGGGAAITKDGAAQLTINPMGWSSFAALLNNTNIQSAPECIEIPYAGDPSGALNGKAGQIVIDTVGAARYLCCGGTTWQVLA